MIEFVLTLFLFVFIVYFVLFLQWLFSILNRTQQEIWKLLTETKEESLKREVLRKRAERKAEFEECRKKRYEYCVEDDKKWCYEHIVAYGRGRCHFSESMDFFKNKGFICEEVLLNETKYLMSGDGNEFAYTKYWNITLSDISSV